MARISVKSPEMLFFLRKIGIDPDGKNWARYVADKINTSESTVQGWLTKGIPGHIKQKYDLRGQIMADIARMKPPTPNKPGVESPQTAPAMSSHGETPGAIVGLPTRSESADYWRGRWTGR